MIQWASERICWQENLLQDKFVIVIDILMQHLYYDWNEAIMHFYRYGSLVAEMLQQYIDEITEDLQDDWETRQIPN